MWTIFKVYWICYNIDFVLCFGFPAARYVGSELPDLELNPPHPRCIGKWGLNHWTAREVPAQMGWAEENERPEKGKKCHVVDNICVASISLSRCLSLSDSFILWPFLSLIFCLFLHAQLSVHEILRADWTKSWTWSSWQPDLCVLITESFYLPCARPSNTNLVTSV